jgi:hypothetical protein
MRRLCALLLTSLIVGSCESRRSTGDRARSALSVAQNTERVAKLEPASGPALPSQLCPTNTADTNVRAQELEHGAALVFTTYGDVETLRRGVAVLKPPPALPSTRSRLDKIPNGMRLVYETRTHEQIATVRATVRRHTQHLAMSCGLVLGEARIAETEEQEPSAPTAHQQLVASAEPAKSHPDAAIGASVDAGAGLESGASVEASSSVEAGAGANGGASVDAGTSLDAAPNGFEFGLRSSE